MKKQRPPLVTALAILMQSPSACGVGSLRNVMY